MSPIFLASPPPTGEALIDALPIALVAAVSSALLAILLMRARPGGLVTTNHRGTPLPVVLGVAVTIAASVALVLAELLGLPDVPDVWLQSAAVVLVGLGGAGLWDDLRGDERPRGFRGHLGALRGGRVTGGLVKLVVGGWVGLAAAWLITDGDIVRTLLGGAAIALCANLLNLFDRAPGRAIKATAIMVACIIPVAASLWLFPAGAILGAAVGVAWPDLRERGMLGDAGANPIGGVLGSGIASAGVPVQLAAVVLLLALNLLSEKVSFSEVIAGNRFLRGIDRAGRLP